MFYVVGEIQSELVTTPNVIYGGVLNYDEMYKFYDAVDIVILPSLNEGFPNAILEAYLSGKCIIASKEAFPEEIELFGYVEGLCPVRWISTILEIKEFFSQGYLFDKGEKASRYVKDNFSWKIYGDEIIKIFNKVIK